MASVPVRVDYNHELKPLEDLLSGVERPGDFFVSMDKLHDQDFYWIIRLIAAGGQKASRFFLIGETLAQVVDEFRRDIEVRLRESCQGRFEIEKVLLIRFG